jgi:predicted RNase H-like nuclease (RuvC/YqgF family)
MNDIVERLIEPWAAPDKNADAEIQRLYRLCKSAADEIARLRTERDNLRAEQKQCEDCDPVGKAAEIERLREKLETARFFIDSLTPHTEYNV